MSTLFDVKSEILPTDIRLRPYQFAAIEAINREFDAGKLSTCLILPTGCGKTYTAAALIRNRAREGMRALVLAHRGELIDQFADSLSRVGLNVGIEKAESRARVLGEPHAVVATVQTMQGQRLQSWPRDYFGLIVTDEAHHATADSYRRIYKHFQGTPHLGITATADRADDETLGSVFDSIAYELTLWEAMTAPEPGPYLSRLKFVQCDVGVDLSSIRTTGGDLNAGDLEEAIAPYVESLANAAKQEIGDRQTLVFTPDVGSAQAFASAFSELGLRAHWVAGISEDRRESVEAYKRGDIQVLCNCNLFTEGFDAPSTSAIVLARPTKSRPLYAQMVGRGTRLAPGKENCLIVDFAWLTARHELVQPIELFDSTHTDDEVNAIATELAKQKKGADLLDLIEEAEAEHKKRLILRVKAREKQIKYRRVSYDPLSAFEALGVPVRGAIEAKGQRGTLTERQQAALERFGIQGADKMSRRAASRMMETLVERSREGLATVKQVSWLIARGVDPEEARAMTKSEASQRLSELFNHASADRS